MKNFLIILSRRPPTSRSNKASRKYDEVPDKGSPEKDGKTEMKVKVLKPEVIEKINEVWEDTDETSMMWELISNGKFPEFISVIEGAPEMAHVRSSDGRGPMWWAYEYKRPEMIDIMKQLRVSDERPDKNGLRPIDLGK